MTRLSFAPLAFVLSFFLAVIASPHMKRSPTFPDSPPSCQLCERDYDQIGSCANASVVFSNVAAILFSPSHFIDVIQCACTDTFQSAYPQCADCFTLTGQTHYLVPQEENLGEIVTGMREICAIASVLLGGVAATNSQLPGQTPITVDEDSGAMQQWLGGSGGGVAGMAVLIGGVLLGIWSTL